MVCGDNSADVADVDANISGTDTLHDSTDVIDNGGDGSECAQYLPWITPDVQFTQRMQAYSRILGVPLPYAGSQSTETVHQHPVDDDDDQSHNCNNDEFISDEDQTGNEIENNDDGGDTGSETSDTSETSKTSDINSDIIENHLDDEHSVNEAYHDDNGNDNDAGYEYSPNLSDISTTPSMEGRFFVDSETESSDDCNSQCKRRRL